MPVDLVQRGPFSYDELTVAANQAGASPSAPRDFTLTNAIFDSTIGEVLEVFVNGVKLVGSGLNATGDEFTVDSNISKITIETDSNLTSATDSAVTTLAEGDTVLIRRVSNRTAKKVDFAPGSVIREADLDNANTQVFHVAQEAIDTALQGMVLDADGRWNASSGGANRVIKNAATPSSSDPADYVATKGYVDGQNATTTVAAIQDKIVTVAGISNDVTTVAGAVAETITYTVTVSNSKFFLNGGEFSSATTNPVLNLQRGSTYKFDYSDSSVSSGSHALGFSSTDSNTAFSGATAYTTGVTDDTVNKIITLVVDASAPSTLYYYCTNSSHNAMGNTMNIAEDSIEIVADNIANVNKVGAIDGNVTKVANIDGDVTKVVALGTDGADVTTVANIGTNGADVTTVAGKATEINTLVNGTDGTSGTGGSTNNLTLIDNVENALPNINTVATNINSVSNFADTYHPSVDSSDTSRTSSTAAPGSASALSTLTEGDLWFDSNDNTLKVYDGSNFNAATSSISTVADQPEFSASDGQGTDNKYFALVHDVGLELVFLNGVRLKRGDDYYCTSSNTSTTPITSGNPANFIRLETVPGSSDILSVMAFGQVSASTVVPPSGGTFTGGVTFEAGTTHNTGSNTFTMPTTRGTNNYVLTRDNSVGTGGTAWKETMLTPTITSLTYPTGDDGNATTALDSGSGAGTQTLVINGTNFTATIPSVQITVGGQPYALGSSYVRNDAQTITVSQVVKRAAGTYTITVTNDTNLTATTTVDFSGTPSFTTSADLGYVFTGDTLSKTIATSGGDGTVTLKADPNGGAKPDWMTIGGTGSGGSSWTDVTGSAGLSTALAGTATNSGNTQTYNFGIIVRDSQNQGSDREFSLVVNDPPTGGDTGGSGSPSSGAYSRYTDGGVTYQIHRFTTTGASTFTLYGAVTADILVIAGGGSGGGAGSRAAGGAGGLRWFTGQSLVAGDYTCTVGSGGGTPPNSDTEGYDGSPSSFIRTVGHSINISASGGGAGGGSASSPARDGNTGGSGGGSNYGGTGGTGDAGNYTPDEGNAGGDGTTTPDYGGGGGGGAGDNADGGDGTSTEGGAGGVGASNFKNQSSTAFTQAKTTAFLAAAGAGEEVSSVRYIAGGGSGGMYTSGSSKPGAYGGGGDGGYGSGGSGAAAGTNGTANTGGGGGGGSHSYPGGSGGSGIIIVRYPI